MSMPEALPCGSNYSTQLLRQLLSLEWVTQNKSLQACINTAGQECCKQYRTMSSGNYRKGYPLWEGRRIRLWSIYVSSEGEWRQAETQRRWLPTALVSPTCHEQDVAISHSRHGICKRGNTRRQSAWMKHHSDSSLIGGNTAHQYCSQWTTCILLHQAKCRQRVGDNRGQSHCFHLQVVKMRLSLVTISQWWVSNERDFTRLTSILWVLAHHGFLASEIMGHSSRLKPKLSNVPVGNKNVANHIHWLVIPRPGSWREFNYCSPRLWKLSAWGIVICHPPYEI